MPDGTHSAAEPFGDEATQYVKEMTLQREVNKKNDEYNNKIQSN